MKQSFHINDMIQQIYKYKSFGNTFSSNDNTVKDTSHRHLDIEIYFNGNFFFISLFIDTIY